MIAAELAQRRFVQLKKNLAQCLGFRMPSGETLSVNLTQRVDGRVSVFVADITVVVAVAIVETCAAHGALHCAYSERASSCLDQMAILRRNRGIKAGPIAQPCKPCSVPIVSQVEIRAICPSPWGWHHDTVKLHCSDWGPLRESWAIYDNG
jgi:hypothetical protein